MNENDKKPVRYQVLKQFGFLGSLGIHFASSIFIGLAIGVYLDKWLGTKPWFTMIFLVFGIVAGFLNFFRVVKRREKD